MTSHMSLSISRSAEQVRERNLALKVCKNFPFSKKKLVQALIKVTNMHISQIVSDD